MVEAGLERRPPDAFGRAPGSAAMDPVRRVSPPVGGGPGERHVHDKTGHVRAVPGHNGGTI
ncbi:hypothetical protein TPA0910_76220 [Streptomyces hygroscopicus subsp. sporocinereus]|uniref:Uncharacterized protein n=1 Tax=Streptomyces hygroscopicus TaxID=1912 RepID=A0ABQ3UC52_STRHY|nr:hypothetical protein TPA0910_76220 [Streptomyces hygroscopicus]